MYSFMKRKLNAIIVSISSDIGTALAADMLSNKWNVLEHIEQNPFK